VSRLLSVVGNGRTAWQGREGGKGANALLAGKKPAAKVKVETAEPERSRTTLPSRYNSKASERYTISFQHSDATRALGKQLPARYKEGVVSVDSAVRECQRNLDKTAQNA